MFKLESNVIPSGGIEINPELVKKFGINLDVLNKVLTNNKLEIQNKQKKEEKPVEKKEINGSCQKNRTFSSTIIMRMINTLHSKNTKAQKYPTEARALIQKTFEVASELGLIHRIYKSDTSDGKTINIIANNETKDDVFGKQNPSIPLTQKILRMVVFIYYSVNGVYQDKLDMKFYHKLVKGNENTYGIVTSTGFANKACPKIGRRDKKFLLSAAESLAEAVCAFAIERLWKSIKNYAEIKDEFRKMYKFPGGSDANNVQIMQMTTQSIEDCKKMHKEQMEKINKINKIDKPSKPLNFHKFWDMYKSQKKNMLKAILKTIDDFKNICEVIDKIYKPVMDELNRYSMTNNTGIIDISVFSIVIEQIYEIIHSDPFLYTLFAVTKLYSSDNEEDLELRDEVMDFEAEMMAIPKNIEKIRTLMESKHDKLDMVYEFRVDLLEEMLGIISVKPNLDYNKIRGKNSTLKLENQYNKLDDLLEFIVSDTPTTDSEYNFSTKLKKKKKNKKNKKKSKEKEMDKEINDFKEFLIGESINAKEVVKIRPYITPEWVSSINDK